MLVCMSRIFDFMSAVVTVQGSVGMFVVYRELLKVAGFISRCEVLCVVYMYSGCGRYYAFCLTCDACNCKCFCMGRMLVLSCRCCMLVSCVHPVQAIRAAFCMTCSLLMVVGDAIGGHMDEAYSRVGLMAHGRHIGDHTCLFLFTYVVPACKCFYNL